jgi:hypothetical protein
MLIQIVNGSSALSASTYAFRPDAAQQPAVVVLAQRMGLPEDDRAVQLVSDTWSIIMSTACRGLGTAGSEPAEPEIVCERIKSTFALFTKLCSPWHADGRPPAGALPG